MKDIVIFFGRFELPDKNALAHRVRSNAIALSNLGYNCVLIGYTKEGKELHIHDTIYPIEYYSLLYPNNAYKWVVDNSAKQIEKVIKNKGPERIKAIIFNGVGYRNIRTIIKMSEEYNIPCVYDVVDWFPYTSLFSLREIVKRNEETLIRKKLLYRINNFIFISDYLQNEYLSKTKNSVVIPSLTVKNEKRFINLPKYSAKDEIKYCFVGSPGKERLDWCIKAFIEYSPKSSTLRIFGVTKNAYCSQYNTHIEDPRVLFMGRRDNRECIEAIAESDFFIFAREDNQISKAGFPTKFSESFAIGTPVITTPTSDLSKYLISGENGILSKECTYESFSDAFRITVNLSKTERDNMRITESPLDEAVWRDVIGDFIGKLV
jgi:glycosyltransferase involved in cell wall biosynthesis